MISNETIKSVIPHYVSREGQNTIIELIETCLHDPYKRHILFIQAGTGSGKTYGYLFPILEWLANQEESVPPILLSTHSLILQNQIFYKDVEVINEIVALDTGTKKYKDIYIRKGRGIYLCKSKLMESSKEKKSVQAECNAIYDELSDIITEEKRKLYKIKKEEMAGGMLFSDIHNYNAAVMYEFEELKTKYNLEISNGTIADLNCVITRARCGKCPHDCIFKTALYQKDNIKIINHALLFSTYFQITNITDKLGKTIYDKQKNAIMVFDEAHHIPSIMQALNNSSTTIYGIKKLISTISKGTDVNSNLGFIGSIDNNSYEILDSIVTICTKINKLISIFLYKNRQIFEESDVHNEFVTPSESQLPNLGGKFLPLSEFTLDIIVQLVLLEKNINRLTVSDEQKNYLESIKENINKNLVLFDAFENGSNISDIIKMIYKYRSSTNYEKDNYEFTYNCLDIDKNVLAEHFSQAKILIFLSATLATKNNFNYFKEQTGFSKEYFPDFEIHELQIKSPFDYEKNMSIYLSGNASNSAPNKELLYTINNLKGGSLLLFTSYENVYKFHRTLSPYIKGKKIFVQAKDNKNIIMDYIAHNNDAVIFATLSFWEGVDLPGNKVELVYIDKLPFKNVQDIIFQRNCLMLEKRGIDAFNEYSINETLLKFKQGMGRLIRSETDVGILYINDSRIITKKYGKFFLNELPAKPEVVHNYIEYIDLIDKHKIIK